MSNNNCYTPKSLSHFAMKIVDKFRLNKACSIGFIESVLQAAADEEKKTQHELEELMCVPCNYLMLRFHTVREEFRDCCPGCRQPMLPLAMVDRKRVLELEAKLKKAGCTPENRSPGG